MAHVQSYDHLITRAILSHYLATLAFIVQQSHINARPIARFNAFASQNGRFRSCDRCATTLSYAIISATDYDPNLNFSIARLFGRFWSCANCERAFSQAGDADSSRAPGLASGLQGFVNVHRGALLLVPQWQCISSFVFCFQSVLEFCRHLFA